MKSLLVAIQAVWLEEKSGAGAVLCGAAGAGSTAATTKAYRRTREEPYRDRYRHIVAFPSARRRPRLIYGSQRAEARQCMACRGVPHLRVPIWAAATQQ